VKYDDSQTDPLERQARELDLNYVKLDGRSASSATARAW
jgi:succinyl-CoA synthetase beta subunit